MYLSSKTTKVFLNKNINRLVYGSIMSTQRQIVHN